MGDWFGIKPHEAVTSLGLGSSFIRPFPATPGRVPGTEWALSKCLQDKWKGSGVCGGVG